jgi:hypothetical protein
MAPIATYSFLPWLRQGIANNVTADDFDPSVKLRATIPVALQLTGQGISGANLSQTVTRNVQMFGPGDIIGLDNRAIFKHEPRNWITNFEPNYLPYIEFYDEDLPWRYTPAAPHPTSRRLRPWIALVVLTEDEFEDGTNIRERPLPFIKVPNASVFPPAEQLWAWAHVHVNRSLAASDAEIVSTDMGAVLPRLESTLDENPDLAYSRILCPRKLAANTAYHAFLVPVFESGRLAGLGLDPTTETPHATFSAWAPYPSGTKMEPEHYPVYFRWYFRTGNVGDFEYLVRLLEPKALDKDVGTRDMDVQDPGTNLPGINDPELEGILKLGGALRIPPGSLDPDDQAEADRYDNWAQPYPHQFQQKLAELINLADTYSVQAASTANNQTTLGPEVQNDPDPLITPPIYGRWHALAQRLLVDRDGNNLSPNDNWVHDLNLDPRYRVAAGFGTKIIRERQEEYMNAAWEQVGDVIEANRRMRAAQVAKEISWIWYSRHIRPIYESSLEQAYTLTTPVHKRIIAQGTTVYHQMKTSVIPPAVASTPMRSITRPGGRLMRALASSGQHVPRHMLIRLNNGAITPVPPKGRPAGAATVSDLTELLLQSGVPQYLIEWLVKFPDMNLPPEFVERLSKSPDFIISDPNGEIRPQPGDRDSEEGERFKDAIIDINEMLEASQQSAEVPPRRPLDIEPLTETLIVGIDPEVTIPRRTLQTVVIPPRIRDQLGEVFVEAMAYPEFDIPMYKPLVEISTELFLPNLNRIEQNSITLLETNQKFIEAYMVGLNHEFARELLWREYPTDQRGSYFRQFWDVSGFFDTNNLDNEALKEHLRDIPPLHLWSRSSQLGDHDHRESGSSEEEVVLVIRGELLKKYPSAVIYVHRAAWQTKPDGSIDNTKERVLEPLVGAEADNPPRTKVKTPLYEAKVEPDIYFFGFDLTVEAAKGDSGENPGDDPGWFIVLEERPGEPRFGLDLEHGGPPNVWNVWNDLAWDDVLPGGTPGDYILIDSTTPSITLTEPTAPELAEKVEQYHDDKFVSWNSNASSADLGYILYQAPVRVAVHAAEMLRG